MDIDIQQPKNNNHIFKDFNDLINSTSLQDIAIHGFVTSLLQRICGQSNGLITIDSQYETPLNHHLIKDNWKFIQSIFNLPNRIKNNQKLIKQTIKYLIHDLNQKYSFQKPIQFDSKKISTRNGKICSSYVLTTISL
jgi:hypothetical protein